MESFPTWGIPLHEQGHFRLFLSREDAGLHVSQPADGDHYRGREAARGPALHCILSSAEKGTPEQDAGKTENNKYLKLRNAKCSYASE